MNYAAGSSCASWGMRIAIDAIVPQSNAFITYLDNSLSDLLRLALTCCDLKAAFLSHEMWELYIKALFKITLSNPPIIPTCVKGRDKFEYFVQFDGRSHALLRAPTKTIKDELLRIGGAQSMRYVITRFKVMCQSARDLPLGYPTLQRIIDLANELAQRGEQSGLPDELRFSADPLAPGAIIIRPHRPSDHEIESRAERGQTDFTGPLHSALQYVYRVDAIVNGVVALTACESDFLPFSETLPFVFEQLKRRKLLRAHPANPPRRAVCLANHPFRKNLSVPRANVRFREVVDEDALLAHHPREVWMARSLEIEPHEADQLSIDEDDPDDEDD